MSIPNLDYQDAVAFIKVLRKLKEESTNTELTDEPVKQEPASASLPAAITEEDSPGLAL